MLIYYWITLHMLHHSAKEGWGIDRAATAADAEIARNPRRLFSALRRVLAQNFAPDAFMKEATGAERENSKGSFILACVSFKICEAMKLANSNKPKNQQRLKVSGCNAHCTRVKMI